MAVDASAYGFDFELIVFIEMLAPKAAEPFVDVPIPRCTCMLCRDEAMSGKFTQYTSWLSGLLRGIPFRVTLIRVASVPLMRSDVLPIPNPSSVNDTSDGIVCRMMGMFRAPFSFLICDCETLL